jgi:hypothetical protein
VHHMAADIAGAARDQDCHSQYPLNCLDNLMADRE